MADQLPVPVPAASVFASAVASFPLSSRAVAGPCVASVYHPIVASTVSKAAVLPFPFSGAKSTPSSVFRTLIWGKFWTLAAR